MRYQLYTVFLMVLSITVLQSCRSAEVFTAPGAVYASTNPDTIDLFLDGKAPDKEYVEIGTVSINRENWLGNLKPFQKSYEHMKKVAASMGGEGIIDMSVERENTGTIYELRGKVIRYVN